MAQPPRTARLVRAKLAAAQKLRDEAAQLQSEAKAIAAEIARAESSLRPRGIVPPGFQWRDGRPRWFAHNKLRDAGWKGVDLKDVQGRWLTLGEAIAGAEAIAEAVKSWRTGGPVPLAFERFAPKAAAQGAVPPSKLDPRSIGALLDAHMGVPGAARGLWIQPPCREFAAIRQQIDRRSKLNRFVDVLAGYAVKPPRDATPKELAAYQAARAKVRASSIFTLEPPAFDPRQVGDVDEALLSFAYATMQDKIGANMAYGVMAEVSAWLEWCVAPKRAIPANWAKTIKRSAPDGRIRVGSWDELAALIAAADQLGMPSIGDAIVLGADLSWNQGDRLAITWDQVKDGRVHGKRRKTGKRGATPLLATLGLRRLAQIRERQAARFGPEVQPTHVIWAENINRPWKPDHYRHQFAKVRALAAQTCPSVADFRDQDLRDTAVTVAYDAGLDLQEIASRTLHSMKRIQDVLEKHYGEISQHVADKGARKLDAYLAEKGVKL